MGYANNIFHLRVDYTNMYMHMYVVVYVSLLGTSIFTTIAPE